MLSRLILFLPLIAYTFGKFPVEWETIAKPRATNIDYRLPNDVVPEKYVVSLEPCFKTFTFKGSVEIAVQALNITNTITLHAHNLNISDDLTSVSVGSETQNLKKSTVMDAERQFYVINLNKDLTVNSKATIKMTFTGTLNDRNEGFYKASYIDENGEERWLATTQFESTDARQAFPCFDEPALKAIFAIDIIREEPYTSVSNMELREVKPLGNGKFQDFFKDTPVLSTYLIAFIVSDFGYVTDSKRQGLYARKAAISDGRGAYGLIAGERALKGLEDFTDVKYISNKIDQAAIPDKWFSAGAMENWGLVTYRESLLLFKEGITTSSEKQSIASIIAHEYSHMWFGNLVSPDWWSYLWLNEGFATYFDYYGTHMVESEFRMKDQFVTNCVQAAFEPDSLNTTRPMTFEAGSPAEIGALFDRVAYAKSGAVVRMMENFLTTEVFKKGLNIYLTNNKFGAAVAQDLYDALQEAVDGAGGDILQGKTVKYIMSNWELQAGFPVLNVSENNDGSVSFRQERYYSHEVKDKGEQLWVIPINFATKTNSDFSSTTATVWQINDLLTITLGDKKKDDWYVVNKQETGYYRVNYCKENWERLIKLLNSDSFKDIHVLNRAQLVDDSLNLAYSGNLDYSIALRLVKYINRETDYIPIQSLTRSLTFLNNQLMGTNVYDFFQQYVRSLFQGAYKALGSALKTSDTHTDRLNRINVLNWLSRMEDEACTKDMQDLLLKKESVEPDLQTPVYCGGMQLDAQSETKWTYIYDQYKKTTEDLQRGRLLAALGCSANAPLINRTLYMVINKAEDYELKPDDRVSAFQSVYNANKLARDTALDFFIEQFDSLTESFTTRQISTIVSTVANRLTTADHQIKFNKFVESQSTTVQSTYGAAFKNAKTTIEKNKVWGEKYLPTITSWLDEEYYVDTSSSGLVNYSIAAIILSIIAVFLV